MRGRWASGSFGSRHSQASHGIRDGSAIPTCTIRQQQDAQRQIEALQQKQHTQPQHEDPAQKLQKYADLKQKGVITDEEFQKLKANLLSQI